VNPRVPHFVDQVPCAARGSQRRSRESNFWKRSSATCEGLAGGSYEVRFFPGFGTTERNLLWQAYTSPVSVTLGSTHEHVDAALATGGQISGHVTDSTTSQPVEGASASSSSTSSSSASGKRSSACRRFQLDPMQKVEGLNPFSRFTGKPAR